MRVISPTTDDQLRAERDLIAAIIAGLARVSSSRLWPGFNPARLPLAVALPASDATWLLDHDRADGYDAVASTGEQPRRLRRAGLDERIVANSVSLIADRPTATIIVEDTASEVELTALAAHELFHVHQASHFPDWGANEASHLLWTWDDPENIARSERELSLLGQAHAAPDDATCARLTRQALAWRRERFGRLPPDARDYENAIELVEGTARYIEGRTATLVGGRLYERDAVNLLDVRRRCYRTGRDWCALLDRLAGPDWSNRLPTMPGSPVPVLTDLLAASIGEPGTADDGWRDGLARATAAIAAERTRRFSRVDLLRTESGGSVVIRSRLNAPIRVIGFDPMNLTGLSDGVVLHERYLSLSVGEARVTILNRVTVTTSMVDHSLFGGLVRARILIGAGGIAAVPDWSVDDLAALGIRITGPFAVRQTGPGSDELLPGMQPEGAQ